MVASIMEFPSLAFKRDIAMALQTGHVSFFMEIAIVT